MERISDVYEIPINTEIIQCDNPIHNDNINRLTLIEESINRALINSNEKLNDTYSKTYKIVYLGVLFCMVIIVALIAYFLINKSN
jgi:hypothetical protein